jgi:hypothetical protein
MVVDLLLEGYTRMNPLCLDDFKFVFLDGKEGSGYYSLMIGEREICIDQGNDKSWTICLCNKFGEVTDEKSVKNEASALAIAGHLRNKALIA